MSRSLGSIGLGLGPWVLWVLGSAVGSGPGLGTRTSPVSLKTVVSWSEKWVRRVEGCARAWSKDMALWAERIGASNEEARFLIDRLFPELLGLPGLAGMRTGKTKSQERPEGQSRRVTG